MNAEAVPAWRTYHEASKHAPGFIDDGHRVDSRIVPRPFKVYRGLAATPLPVDHDEGSTTGGLDLGLVSRLLRFSAGILRRSRDGQRLYRAAACTGGAYHIELYIVCGALNGLDAGVYQYAVHDHSLRLMRGGDYRGHVLGTLCEPNTSGTPGLFLVFTTTFWRNAWRYGDRAYRHAFWDSGTIIANLEALCAATPVDFGLCLGFKSVPLQELLGVDARREAVVSLVAIGEGSSPASAESPLETIDYEVVPASPVEIEYPAIGRAYRAAQLSNCDEVRAWRRRSIDDTTGRRPSHVSLQDIERLIRSRGSARRFRSGAIGKAELEAVHSEAARSLDADFLAAGGAASLVDTYAVVNAVEGCVPGVYFYDRNVGRLEGPSRRTSREDAAHLALDQALAGEAAACVYFVAGADSLSDRGYAATQLEAGVRGGRVYLAAYARDLRATALTFYDDPVAEALEVGERPVLFLVAVGR